MRILKKENIHLYTAGVHRMRKYILCFNMSIPKKQQKFCTTFRKS